VSGTMATEITARIYFDSEPAPAQLFARLIEVVSGMPLDRFIAAHVTGPLMIDYSDNTAKPYKEFPKGIKIIFYDNNLKESGNIVSDYAVQRIRGFRQRN